MEKGVTRNRLSKNGRITDPLEFRNVMREGRKAASRNFVVFLKNGKKEFHRLGIVVQKEIGSASYRNRVKRLIREFFRLHRFKMGGAFDCVVLVRKGCTVGNYSEVREELGRVFSIGEQ